MVGELDTYISFNAGIVADLVEVVCCHSRFYFAANDIQDFAGETADFSHGILAGFVKYGDFISTEHFVLGVTILGPRGFNNVVGYWPSGGKRVDWS